MVGNGKILFFLLGSCYFIAILLMQIRISAFLLCLGLEIAIISVTQRKDIPVDLYNKKRKVDVSKIKIDKFQFRFTLNIIIFI